MESDGFDEEVLAFGAAREHLPLRERARRHPWLLGLLALVVLAGAVVAIRNQFREGPALPTVADVQVDDVGENERTTGPWSSEDDGRPGGPAQIELDATLTFTKVGAEGATVLGMSGPGVTASSARPASVTSADPILTTEVRATLDCTQVPMPVREDAYTLRVRTAADGRTTTGPIAASSVVKAWARLTASACGSWLARSRVTVTDAVGTASARTPSAELTLTLTNTGAAPVVAGLDQGFGSAWAQASPIDPVTVAPGTSRKVVLRVNVDSCDGVTEARYRSEAPTTDDIVGMVATVGESPPRRGQTPWVEGTGATGIVLGETARSRIESTLLAACGGLNPFAVLVADDGVRYDPPTRVLTVAVEIFGTPGRVRDVTLTTNRPATDPVEYTPLWTSTGRLRPDFTGQARTTLRYRAPTGTLCAGRGVLLPGFEITARVPEPTGVRVVRFGDFGVPWQDSVIRAAICPDPND